jgi:CRISPR system Cascade subunit CasE
MYLTQLSLNRFNRKGMKALSDIYRLHQTIMQGFAAYEDTTRVLFRVEPEERQGVVSILVQSALAPDWSRLAEENQAVVGVKVKEFSPRFRSGDLLRFRLRANPTVSRGGKRYGLIRDESLQEWLNRKEEKIGANFRSVIAIDEGYTTGSKDNGEGRHRLSLKTARFEGILQVADLVVFLRVLENGIGPAKAFGCGLLSLARG